MIHLNKRFFSIKPLIRQQQKSSGILSQSKTLEIWPSKTTNNYEVRQEKTTGITDSISNFNSNKTTNNSATQTLFPLMNAILPTPLLQPIDSAIHHFLPRGYASGSVPLNYFDYTRWSIAAAVASSAAMVLSTQSLLYAIGLGAGSIPTAAALNWVLKDGLGQLGGVLFASLVNNRFDSDPKRWRVVAAVALDGAVFLQALTPLAPALFLPVAALANVGMNVSWLAASASRAGIHLSFSNSRTGTNIADITAKAGSQTTFASTMGMACGVIISPFVGSSPELIIPTLVSISLIHLGCTYRGLRHVTLNTLNEQRAEFIAYQYVTKNTIPSIDLVSIQEVVIGKNGQHLFQGFQSVLLSTNVLTVNDDILQYIDPTTLPQQEMDNITMSLHKLNYVVIVQDDKEKKKNNDKKTIGLIIEEKAESSHVLLGHLHATKLRHLLSINNDVNACIKETNEWMAKESTSMEYTKLLIENGWNVDNLFLEEDIARRISLLQ